MKTTTGSRGSGSSHGRGAWPVAAVCLLLAPSVGAHPDTPFLSAGCAALSPRPEPCAALEIALSVACPLGNAALGGQRRFCATPDALAEFAAGAAADTFGAGLDTFGLLVPRDLPRPPPGSVTEVASSVKDWLNENYNGSEPAELWARVVGESAPQTFSQVFLTVQSLVDNNGRNALMLVFRESEPGSQGGTACITYTFTRDAADGQLANQWAFLGLGTYESPLPSLCRGPGEGPPGLDTGLSWLPVRGTIAWHGGPWDPVAWRCTGAPLGITALPDPPAGAAAIPGLAAGARCAEVHLVAAGQPVEASAGVPGAPPLPEVGR